MPFVFNPVNGLEDSTAFPTVPPSEATYREQFNRLHKQTRDYINLLLSGWIPVDATWTYSSISGVLAVVTVPSGAAGTYRVGDCVKLTQGVTVKNAYVVAFTDTSLTLAMDKDALLTNAAITDIWYSHCVPVGFPDWLNWTPTYTGYSAIPGTSPTGGYRYRIIGKTCFFMFHPKTTGTSNSTLNTATLPIPVSPTTINQVLTARIYDNGTPAFGIAIIEPGSTILDFRATASGAAFTATGSKFAEASGFYEI